MSNLTLENVIFVAVIIGYSLWKENLTRQTKEPDVSSVIKWHPSHLTLIEVNYDDLVMNNNTTISFVIRDAQDTPIFSWC